MTGDAGRRTLEPPDRQAIAAWRDRLPADVRLGVVLTGDPRSREVEAFAGALAALAPRVRVARHDLPGEMPPALLVGPIRYLAVPAGTELLPFLEALAREGGGSVTGPRVADAVPPVPSGLRLYVSSHCAFCPLVTRDVIALATEARVALTVIDAALFADLAARDQVQSVPTLVLGRFRATGTIDPDAIREALRRGGDDRPDAAAIERMLSEGNAAAVATLAAGDPGILPALLDLAAAPAMSTRLGAMTALSELGKEAPEVAAGAEPGIWERFERAPREARGDLLYLLGEIGTTASLRGLHALVATGADDEMHEAAIDAAARIAERTAE